MNILVVGCGKVGARLADVLSKQGHDISIVSKTEEGFDALPSDFNGFTTTGVPIDQDVLKKAGIESCDALAAVTPDDNINIMVSELAKEIFKVPRVFVRIYDPRRDEVFSSLGMRTICPTNLTVSAVCSALNEDTKTVTLNLGSRTMNFTTIIAPKSFIGRNVSDIEFEEDEVLYAVQRGESKLFLVGLKDIIIQKEDKLIFSKIVD